MKKIIHVEEVIKLMERKREIDRIDLKDVRFFQNGKEINIPERIIEEFRFTGLPVSHFVDMGAHEEYHTITEDGEGNIKKEFHWKHIFPEGGSCE